MDTQPLVSIIIPTYNRAEYLKQAIKSVLAQTYTNFELLILDNCSPDKTPDIVAQFNDPRIKYIRHQCNIRGAANWAYGLYWSKGEYVSFLGDDDRYTANFISSRVNTFKKHEYITAVFSNYDICNEQNIIIGSTPYLFDYEKILSGNELLRFAVNRLWSLGSTLYKRDVVENLFEKCNMAGKAGDTFLNINISLIKTSNNVAWICEKGLIYRHHDLQDSLLNGEMTLIGNIIACSLPFMFNDCINESSILKNGSIWAYKILSRNAWNAGQVKMARRYTRWEILANPFRIKPWLRYIMYLI